MLMQIRDVELMRIIAMSKDIPVGLNYGILPFKDSYISSLIPYVKNSKSKRTYRLTNEGYSYLKSIGLNYQKDKYPVGQSKTMSKRIENAKVIIMMYLAGVNIFKTEKPFYTTTASVRRKKGYGNVVGSSTFLGVLLTVDTSYVVFWAKVGIDYPFELEMAKKVILLYNGNPNIKFIFIADDYSFFNGFHYLEGYESIIAKADTLGIKQIRIISVGNYEEILNKKLKLQDYLVAPVLNVTCIMKYVKENTDAKVLTFEYEHRDVFQGAKIFTLQNGDIEFFKLLGFQTEIDIPSGEPYA